jgi:DNA-binding beta-propeller fold protein YncE
VQFLCSLISSEDVEPEPSAFARFILGADLNRPVDYLVRPYGLAFWQGKLYVCDSGAKRGAIFDFAAQEFRAFGHQGAYRLQMPINVSLAPRGEKYVTDTVGGRILVLDESDRPVRALGGPEGMRPCGVAIRDDELYVGDLARDAVLVLDPMTGAVRRQLGGRGGAPGRFSQPTNLAIGPDGALFVSDTLNARVQKLDRQGRVLRVFGARGRALGQMVRPKGIAVDREGRLYVADAAAETVLVFNREGHLLMLLGAPGLGRGDLSLPAGVAISYQGVEHFQTHAAEGFEVDYLIFVSSQLGPRKISVYGFGTSRDPGPPRRATRSAE